MTCARRGAGAHPPAASAPSRSPSAEQAPPRDRSRPDPRGGRARLALLLPVLALLLGAFGLLLPTPVQADGSTVWSATLNVDAFGNGAGCDHDIGTCASRLTDDDFVYKGTTYTIVRLVWRSATNKLRLTMSGKSSATIKAALRWLTLHVSWTQGSATVNKKFEISDGVDSGSGVILTWSLVNPPWTEGKQVSFALKAKPAKPGNFSATAGYKQITLSWDNPNDPRITHYNVQVRKAGGTGSWIRIPGSGAATTRHIVKNLDNGEKYECYIQAVNDSGTGPNSNQATATPDPAAASTVNGLTLSGFKVEPASGTRLKVSWRVKNPSSRRSSFRVAWRMKDLGTLETNPWRHKDVSNISSNPHVHTWALNAGMTYDVRLYVRPRSGREPGDSDIAFEDSKTTYGQLKVPKLSQAWVNDEKLGLQFDTLLDELSVPAASAFTVAVAEAADPSVTGVTVSRDTVTLTLNRRITYGHTATLNYTKPSENGLRAWVRGGGSEVATFFRSEGDYLLAAVQEGAGGVGGGGGCRADEVALRRSAQ